MAEEVWKQPETIAWSQVLLDSYEKLLGCSLLERKGNAADQAAALFFAPFVVVSHGTQTDPILNYGNQIALDLWEMSWEQLTQTPSRLTAEPIAREERTKMLLQAARQGFINHYQGVRISRTGRRFEIDNAIVWNLTDTQNRPCGQAATFSDWSWLS